MLSKLLKLPVLKRLIPSLLVVVLKLLKKNRGYFKIKNIRMFLDFLDPIDRQMILYQEFENLEINFLIKQINNNKVDYFLDVGANCGFYSIYIAKELSNIKILSFEPNKEAYFKFNKTLQKNPKLSKKIQLVNFGLSNKSTKLKMQSMVKHGYAQTGGSSIINNNEYEAHEKYFGDFKIGDESIKLYNEKIAIKIDVEGHEIYVLEGLKKIIKKNKLIIQIEIFENNFTIVNNFLLSFGYKNIFKVKKRSNYFYSNIN